MPEMKEAAPSFIFFKLKPWRSPKVALRPQAIPSRAVAHGASPRPSEHIPESQHHLPQNPRAMPMSFTFIHGHHYHGWGQAPHSPCMAHPTLGEGSPTSLESHRDKLHSIWSPDAPGIDINMLAQLLFVVYRMVHHFGGVSVEL